MKVIFVLLFACLFILFYAHAGNYYLSSVSGSDSRTVAEAQNPATPWKTLDKLNSFFINLKPGDSVLLKRGETFYGSIIVNKSGSTTLPIVIGAYGSGKKPVITSLVTLTGWVSKGNGIWESYNSSLGSMVRIVLLNGTVQEMGRYPNSNATNNGYLNFESHVDKTSITDNQLSTAINWKGAELVLRPRHWVLNRSLITAQSGHKISYTTNSPYEPYENYGYFIQNSLKTLDKLGEWYYNPATSKLSVYFGSKGPSSYTLQAATTTRDLISSTKSSNVTFNNLFISGSNGSGFNIKDGSNIHIQNCDILFSGITGIVAGGHPNLHIENCTITNSNNNAIDLEYGVNSAVVRNNKILNTAVMAGMLKNGEGAGLAIYTNGDGATVESNDIRQTGFIGITFYGSNVTIKNNFIDSFCFVKDDGGGIYSHGEAVVTRNRKVIGNIITDGIGAGKGTDNADKRAVTGIYMDANTTNVYIADNTVTTCHQGILIQSTTGITIKNNTVFNNVRQMTMVRDKDNNPVRNSIITQNIFFSKSPIQWALYALSSGNDLKLFGRLDSNYYARPLDDRLTIYNSYVGSSGTVVQNLDLGGWQETYGQDKHSKKTAKQIVPFKVKSLIGSNKFAGDGNFTNDIKGLSGSSCAVSLSKSGLLDGGYLQVAPSALASAVYLKIGSVTAGKNYVLKYSLKGSVESTMSIGANIKKTGSPYTDLTQPQGRRITKSRTENEMVFSPSASESSAYVVFRVNGLNKYYIDNVKFYEANVQVTNPDDSIKFEYNASKSTKSFSLTGNYVDTKGKAYSGKVTLQPYASIILIKSGSAVQNIAPSVSVHTVENKSVFNPFTRVQVYAEAADADGSITKVEFFNGSTLLLTEYKPSYDCILDSLAPGNYVITAKATDDNGLVSTSSTLKFSVVAVNTPPSISITSPKSAANYSAPATIEIAVAAADTGGSISKVEYFNGGTLLSTEYKLPYTYTWQNVPAGNYIITVKATDNTGLMSTKSVAVSVKSPQASRATFTGASADTAKTSSLLSAVIPVNVDAYGKTTNKVINSSLNDSKPLSSADIAKLNNFHLSPNPAVNTVRISFEGLIIYEKATLTIQNLSGAVFKRVPIVVSGKQIDTDVSSLVPGMYLLSISGSNFLVTKKLVKVN